MRGPLAATMSSMLMSTRVPCTVVPSGRPGVVSYAPQGTWL